MIEIPCQSKRQNPYMIDENGNFEDVGEYPTLTGLITEDQFGNEERGFASTIDMDYKDKPDQYTDIKYHYWEGDEKEFRALCKELGIQVVVYKPWEATPNPEKL